MKGQFMLISSVVIGIMIMSAASTITEIHSQDFRKDDISHITQIIRDEAGNLCGGDCNLEDEEIEGFREMVSSFSGYSSDVEHYNNGSRDCFNVTIESQKEEVFLECIS